MADQPYRRSPLAVLDLAARTVAAGSEAGVVLGQRIGLGKIDLRGDPGDAGFLSRVADVVRLDLPTTPNGSVADDATTILRLGPDHWLIVTAPGEQDRLARQLTAVLRLRHAAVTDVSSGETVIRVTGPDARRAIATGCGLDLDPPAFGPGRCARTRVGPVTATVHQIDEAPTFDLYVARSYALSFWGWLEAASREFGVAIAAPPG